MTLPAIIANYQEKVLITQLKQAYSIIDNAFRLATQEEGTVDTWGSNFNERRLRAFEIIPKYIKTSKVCNIHKKGCIGKQYKSLAKTLNPINVDGAYETILLENGISIWFYTQGQDCTQDIYHYNLDDSKGDAMWTNACFSLLVDVNGPKPPNIASVDLFSFLVFQDGITPSGTKSTNSWKWSWVLTFDNQCLRNRVYGVQNTSNCTAWVLTNENMDYKRCPEKLGWEADKQKSCK